MYRLYRIRYVRYRRYSFGFEVGKGNVFFLCFLEAALDFAERYAENAGYVSQGFVLCLEPEDVFDFTYFFTGFSFVEVVVLLVVALKFKAKEAGVFGDVVDDDVFCIVLVFSCADFDLLEVAEVVITGTTSKGYSCVEKVDEFSRSCEVVLGNRLVAPSLGSVGYDDGCEVVFLL